VDDKTTPAHARTVAEALIGVKHTVGASDKVKLEALVKDASTPAPVKTLASVLVNLNHTPSAAEKEQLKPLAAAK
jgi:hypothetical protein